MLAVALLAFSDAYTYQTFFKVFTIVIIFALFYGTFLLPVILSIFTPKPYDLAATQSRSNEATELFVIEKDEESELQMNSSKNKRTNDKGNSNCDNNEVAKLNDSN